MLGVRVLRPWAQGKAAAVCGREKCCAWDSYLGPAPPSFGSLGRLINFCFLRCNLADGRGLNAITFIQHSASPGVDVQDILMRG